MAAMNDRRRAERFAELLEEAGGGRRHHRRTPHDEQLAELVALRHELAGLPPTPDLDPEFRTGLRAMLVATAEREGIGATAHQPPADVTAVPAGPRRQIFTRGPRARTAAIAGVAIGAVAFAGMSTASDSAMPGDALYGVKRSTERAQLALASSEVGRGQLYLSFAQTRAQEALLLEDELARVLGDMDRDTSQGVRLLNYIAANQHDRAALDVIDSFVEEQREALRQLAGQVDRDDAERVDASLALLHAIDERSSELRATLATSCTSIASVDELGPVPADCVALPPPRGLAPAEPDSGASAPSTVPSQPDQPARSAPATAQPTPTASRSSDVASPSTEIEPTPSPTSTGTTEPAEPRETPDGLIDGLNRLLGNLLGGG